MDRRAFRRCMHILESRHEPEDWSRGLTPFEILVSTVLSQSTNVANERRGMEGLRTAFGRITPQGLASQKTNDLARAIWHAGLSNRKASRIRALAGRIAARSDDRLRDILRRPTKEARDLLLTLPGVGLKTADVLLAMAADRPVFPVDTHVARIARRWRIVRPADGYEATRAGLERWTPFEKREAWHLGLIAHGRTLCKAANPACERCAVSRDCDWFQGRAARAAKRLKRSNR